MSSETIEIKNALLSVSDKTNLLPLAQALIDKNVTLYSTGGTAKYLISHGVQVQSVSDITQFPEMMGGRIKTLHPKILGGVLGRRGIDDADAKSHGIPWIDMVVCNLYPFKETISQANVTMDDAVENIDIGGPTMIRAAAKNFKDVLVLVSPNDYSDAIAAVQKEHLPMALRQKWSHKAFAHVSAYDAMIADYLNDEPFKQNINLTYTLQTQLRYGENPHQQASVYRDDKSALSILDAKQLQGKQLSFNNLIDAEAAINAVADFDAPASVVIKHANPCGMAVDNSIHQAFSKAFHCDKMSAFGGVIALNRAVDEALANDILKNFVEIVIAPEFSEAALKALSQKSALRCLALSFDSNKPPYRYKFINGGVLVQSVDDKKLTQQDLKVVTNNPLSDEVLEELLFAWQCVKHLKSNAIAVCKEQQTIGLGGGLVSRVDAVNLALAKAGTSAKGAYLASDAFFPFSDSIELAHRAGIKAIIQPGGSKKDDEVISACNQFGIDMVLTGFRCFNH